MAEPRKLSPKEFRTMQLLELDIKEKMQNKGWNRADSKRTCM